MGAGVTFQAVDRFLTRHPAAGPARRTGAPRDPQAGLGTACGPVSPPTPLLREGEVPPLTPAWSPAEAFSQSQDVPDHRPGGRGVRGHPDQLLEKHVSYFVHNLVQQKTVINTI